MVIESFLNGLYSTIKLIDLHNNVEVATSEEL